VTIFPLDSHPIGEEIGVFSQQPALAFDAELDMVVQNGIEIGRVAASPTVPGSVNGRLEAEIVDGDLEGVLEGMLRRVLREVSGLGRLLPW
jgi:hypothetical protein